MTDLYENNKTRRADKELLDAFPPKIKDLLEALRTNKEVNDEYYLHNLLMCTRLYLFYTPEEIWNRISRHKIKLMWEHSRKLLIKEELGIDKYDMIELLVETATEK